MAGATDEKVQVSPAELQQMQDLYDRGLYVQAYSMASKHGPLHLWQGTAQQVFAGRLAGNTGSQRLRERLHIQAYRGNKANHEAAYYYAWRKLGRRGPLAAWYFIEEVNRVHQEPTTVRADALAFQARVAGYFRDFETADELIREAEEIAPGRGWVQIEKSSIFQQRDNHEQALAVLNDSRDRVDSYRSNVQASADVLLALNRDSEAIDLLVEGCGKAESGAMYGQLAMLQMEIQQHEDALKSLERMEALMPLIGKTSRDWLESRRCDALYHLGRYEQAAECAEKLDNAFHKKFAARLRNPTGRRVHLPVGFVRQHHDTCAPATLAALGKFWGRPVDHVELAAEICYGGTPDHSERNWAEQDGWVVKEFQVTLETAQALLDRGVPFTLTTTGPTSGHLQAVIGYDSNRETLIIRDPSQRIHGDVLAEEFLKNFASSGPRGMVMVPRESAHLLDGIDLPAVELYDRYYKLRRALHGHDRPEAERQYQQSRECAPRHRMTMLMRRALAHYDANKIEILASIEEALQEFPDDGHLLLWKGATLRDLARRAEHLDFLRELCSRKSQDPVFWREYAEALSVDARMEERADQLLRRALRWRPLDAENISALARLCWMQRKLDSAARLSRFAACLAETNEGFSQYYFSVSRHLRQTDFVMDFLERRRARLGGRASGPARTLYWAFSCLNRLPDAFKILDSALAERPEDGELLLFASDAHARYAHYGIAADLLEKAEACTQRNAWLRQKAEMAGYLCDFAEALRLWRLVLEVEPLAEDVNRSVARLLAETEGRGSAITHLRDVCRRFPHNIMLHKLLYEWLQEEGDESVELLLRHLAEINPDDSWTRRELAVYLGSRGKTDEALAEVDLAVKLEPNNPYSHTTRSHVCKNAGRMEEAGRELREALTLSVDNGYAMKELVNICKSVQERRDALGFIKQELIRQVIFGDALLAFREAAYSVLEPEELLVSLKEALEARPDLWHAWTATILQLCDMGRTDEALALAGEATARFPLLPRVWVDLSVVHETRRERAEQIASLKQALQINPHWSHASRKLSKAQENSGDFEQARITLELAVARAPLDYVNHGMLAEILWKTGAKAQAVDRVEHALRLNPAYDWGWDALREWGRESGQPGRALEFARNLTVTRAGDPQTWLILARSLHELPERLEAVDKAIALHPKWMDAHDLRVMLLAQAERFDEAIAACNHSSWQGHPPVELRGREAWLLMRRGKKHEAQEKLKKVLADYPGYYWGWSMMADWMSESGQKHEYLKAAQQMVRLTPRNATAYGYLADAKFTAGDKAGGKAALMQAVQIDPSYAYGACRLLDLQIAANETEAAAKTLELIRKHIGGWQADESEVKLATLKRRDKNAALAALGRLCKAPDNYSRCLNSAIQCIDQAGWSDDTDRILREALPLEGTNPEVGAIWVRRWAPMDKRATRRHLYALAEKQGDLPVRAFVAYINELAAKKKRVSLKELMEKHGPWLRQNIETWGAMGYAMANSQEYKSTITWMNDWREKKDAEPWMLFNLVSSLRHFERYAEACEVGRRALELKRDNTTSRHLLWLAFESAVSGDAAAGRRFLSGSESGNEKPTDYFQAVKEMTKSMIKIQETPMEERRKAFRANRKYLGSLLEAQLRGNRMLRVSYKRAIKRMAGDAGTWAGFNFFLPSINIGGPGLGPSIRIVWIGIVLLSVLLRSCS